MMKQGREFLITTPLPNSNQWEGKEYWRRSLPELKRAYNQICSYCAQWVSNATGSPTVDHYIPRSVSPSLAYEWSNFRLACSQLNSRKGASIDVLDPFSVIDGWFIIDFSSFMILPNPALRNAEKEQVVRTIRRLKLNVDEAFISSRIEWFDDYMKHEYTFGHLQKRAPFLAYEIERQGLKLTQEVESKPP